MLHRLQLFLLSLVTLLVAALLGKLQFAIVHSALRQGQGVIEWLSTLLWGLRFDLAVSAAFALCAYLAAQLLALLPRGDLATQLRRSTAIAAAALLLLHGADTLYYGEAGRHMGYELKEGVNSGAALAISALSTHAVTFLIQLLLIAAVLIGNSWLFKRLAPYEPAFRPLGQRLAGGTMLLPILLLTITMLRGGIQSVPLEPLHAQRIGDPQRATLALNGAYNALFASLTPYSVNPLFANPPTEEDMALLRQMYRAPLPKVEGQPRQRNVVMILLESWDATYMAPYGHDRVTTPNFDRLRTEGFTTRAMLAGGSRTTEGMFVSFCSTQNPLGKTVAQSQLQNYDYECLPRIMRGAGWHTAFFQGSNKETSGTGSFAQLLGFEESFGKSDIRKGTPQYEQNSWGYHDPDIYRFTLERMRHMPQPFLVGINSNSTHDSQLPDGVTPLLPMDSPLNSYQSMLHFADAALGEFVAAVRSTPGLEDTIFVLVADHTAGPTPPQPLQKHLIPFAILAPELAVEALDVTPSQRDIAPTLLQLLNMPIPSHFSGQSLLAATPQTHYGDYYHQGVMGWIEGAEGVEFPITEPGKISCFNLAAGLNTKQQHPCTASSLAMQRRSLAFTHLSQTLLFAGQLQRFAELR